MILNLLCWQEKCFIVGVNYKVFGVPSNEWGLSVSTSDITIGVLTEGYTEKKVEPKRLHYIWSHLEKWFHFVKVEPFFP